MINQILRHTKKEKSILDNNTYDTNIFLQDVNDETPTFKSASYVAEIGENSPRATPILFLGGNVVPEVFDYDSGTNGTFQLFLEGDQGIFEVRKNILLNFFFSIVV